MHVVNLCLWAISGVPAMQALAECETKCLRGTVSTRFHFNLLLIGLTSRFSQNMRAVVKQEARSLRLISPKSI